MPKSRHDAGPVVVVEVVEVLVSVLDSASSRVDICARVAIAQRLNVALCWARGPSGSKHSTAKQN